MENNQNYYNKEQLDSILKKRERTKLSRKYYELESEEAGISSKIFWNVLSLLIINPLIVVGTVYYYYSEFSKIIEKGDFTKLIGFGSNLKWMAITVAISFTATSLSLCFYCWRLSSVKRRKAEISREMYHNT